MNLGCDVALLEEAGAGFIHVDVMDGHFVPNLTMGVPVLKQLRRATSLPLDVHLMVENPLEQLPWFLDAGADIVTVHAEALDAEGLARAVSSIHEAGAKAAVSLKPATPPSALAPGARRPGHGARHERGAGLLGAGLHRGQRGARWPASRSWRATAGRRAALVEVDGGIGAAHGAARRGGRRRRARVRQRRVRRRPTPPPRHRGRARRGCRRPRRAGRSASSAGGGVRRPWPSTPPPTSTSTTPPPPPSARRPPAAMAPYQAAGAREPRRGRQRELAARPRPRRVFEALEAARRSLARDLGARRPSTRSCSPPGATEADGAALLGIARAAAQARRRRRRARRARGSSRAWSPRPSSTTPCSPPRSRLESAGLLASRASRRTARASSTPTALAAALDAPTRCSCRRRPPTAEVGSCPARGRARARRRTGRAPSSTPTPSRPSARWPLDLAASGTWTPRRSPRTRWAARRAQARSTCSARTPFEPHLIWAAARRAAGAAARRTWPAPPGFAAAVRMRPRRRCPRESPPACAGCATRLYARHRGRSPASSRHRGRRAPGSEDFLPNVVHVLGGRASRARRSSCASTCRASACRAARPARRTRSSPAMCCARSASTPIGRTARLRVSMGRWTSERDVDAFVCALEASLDWDM